MSGVSVQTALIAQADTSDTDVPSWQQSAASEIQEIISDLAFPCVFSRNACRKGLIKFAFVDDASQSGLSILLLRWSSTSRSQATGTGDSTPRTRSSSFSRTTRSGSRVTSRGITPSRGRPFSGSTTSTLLHGRPSFRRRPTIPNGRCASPECNCS